MSRSTKVQVRYGKRSVWVLAALVAGFALAGLAALAVAKTTGTTIKTAHSSKLSATIVVDPHGMTLYELNPETAGPPAHLLCSSAICLNAWPPMKVSKNQALTKASAIKGKLGRLHRSGFYQLTLDGRPLYHFSGDTAKGDVNGNGLPFPGGGPWHVVKVSSASQGAGTTTTTSSTSSSSTSPYPY